MSCVEDMDKTNIHFLKIVATMLFYLKYKTREQRIEYDLTRATNAEDNYNTNDLWMARKHFYIIY